MRMESRTQFNRLMIVDVKHQKKNLISKKMIKINKIDLKKLLFCSGYKQLPKQLPQATLRFISNVFLISSICTKIKAFSRYYFVKMKPQPFFQFSS